MHHVSHPGGADDPVSEDPVSGSQTDITFYVTLYPTNLHDGPLERTKGLALVKLRLAAPIHVVTIGVFIE